jgi:hypothetical protein
VDKLRFDNWIKVDMQGWRRRGLWIDKYLIVNKKIEWEI